MKKIFAIVMSVFLFASCVSGGNGGNNEEYGEQVRDKYDFGEFRWGMSIDNVVGVHGGGYAMLDENTIRYEIVRLEGFPSDAEYVFEDGKLVGATYFITPESQYDDSIQYLEDYDKLVDIYDEQFGEPVEKIMEFAPGKTTDSRERQAALLVEGNMLFRNVWKTKTTEIRAVMARKGDVCIGVKMTPITE